MAASEFHSLSPFRPSNLLDIPDGDDLLPSVEEVFFSPRKSSATDHKSPGDGSESELKKPRYPDEPIVIQDSDRWTIGQGDSGGENRNGKVLRQGSGIKRRSR